MLRIIQIIVRRQNVFYTRNINGYVKMFENCGNQFLGIQFRTFARVTSRESFGSSRYYCTTVLEQKNVHNEQVRINSSQILDRLNKLKPDEGLVLLEYCGHAILNDTHLSRTQLLDTIWDKLQTCGNLNEEHYHAYLQQCIEHKKDINFQEFLQEMQLTNSKPNQQTYQLLLTCMCECGNLDQALQVVEAMKNESYVADESLFNSLVLGHAVKGGLNDAKTVFETMRRAHVPVSSSTYLSLLRGLVLHNDRKDFFEAFHKYSMHIQGDDLLELLLVLALSDNEAVLNEVLETSGLLEFGKQELEQLKLLCIRLVHRGKADAAILFYRKFVKYNPLQDGEHYAAFLLREMLFSGTPVETIIAISKDLKTLNKNMLGLESVTEIALKNNLNESVWKLFDALPLLRPHYFWPLLKEAGHMHGEMGIFQVIKKMLEYNVKPTVETIEFYCLPFCDLTDSESLLIRLQNIGVHLSELSTPVLSFLLRRKEVNAVLHLCTSLDFSVQSEKLIQPLFKAWIGTRNNESIAIILKSITKKSSFSSDHVGNFLFKLLRYCQTMENHLNLLNLIKAMHINQIFISSSVADALLQYLKSPAYRCGITPQLEEAIDSLVNASMKQTQSFIPHPRDMDINDLECHLLDLQNKKMETRGVLRRLIQNHSNLGNEERAYELREQFLRAGYSQTPGMISSLLFASVLKSNSERAYQMYKELKDTSPTFLLDEFKIIDLATLLVTNKQFDLAMSVLSQETKNRQIKGGKPIQRNCWLLISSANDENEIEKLFNFLVENRYCKITNVLLGPLVKFHLNRNNLTEAVQKYTECTEKYKCTPLQLELLCSIIEAEDTGLLQEALDATTKIHGSSSTTISFIAALAQTGRQNLIQKFLMDENVIEKSEIERRCERWVTENKLSALETLAQAAAKLRHPSIDVNFIYYCIMKLHSNNNDCDSAVKFYRQLLEESIVPQNVIDELLKLVGRCKYKMPELLIKSQVG